MRRITTRVVYENRWMRLVEDRIVRASGAEGVYSYVEKAPCAIVIPLEGDRLTLIEQFRYPPQAPSLEFPSGALDASGETDPVAIARTELREETGLIGGRWTHLGDFCVAPGITGQRCSAFLAEDLTPGPPQPEAEEDGLVVRMLAMAEFEDKLRAGEILDSLTLAAWALFRSRSRG